MFGTLLVCKVGVRHEVTNHEFQDIHAPSRAASSKQVAA